MDCLLKQKYRGDGIYLNGMEYMFYGVPAIVVFGMLCIVFHLIYFKIKKFIEIRGCRKTAPFLNIFSE